MICYRLIWENKCLIFSILIKLTIYYKLVDRLYNQVAFVFQSVNNKNSKDNNVQLSHYLNHQVGHILLPYLYRLYFLPDYHNLHL
jgi:hypothetical protein